MKEWYEGTVVAGELKVDLTYQRPCDESWVRKIVREYDPAKVNQIIVSQRSDRTKYIIDGAHTVRAVIAKEGGTARLSAKVFLGLTREEEAEMFLSFNQQKKPMLKGDMLKSRVAFGDKVACEYVRLLDKSGIPWTYSSLNKHKVGIGRAFNAHDTGERVFKKYGADIFSKALYILKMTSDITCYEGKLLAGIAFILSKADVDMERMIRVINGQPKTTWVREAREYLSSIGGRQSAETAYGKAIAVAYNKGLRKGRIVLM